MATSGLTFYIGAFVFMFGSYSMSIEKSLLTQCVSDNELGKVFAFNAALENFGPLGASQIYAKVMRSLNLNGFLVCESYETAMRIQTKSSVDLAGHLSK